MTTRTDGPDWFHANAPGDEPVRPVDGAQDDGAPDDGAPDDGAQVDDAPRGDAAWDDDDLLDADRAPRTNRLTVVLAVAVVAACTFTAGALVQRELGGSDGSAAAAGGLPSGFPGGLGAAGFPGGGEVFPGGGAAAATGGPGQAGAVGGTAGTATAAAPVVVGTVTSVEGATLVVENFAGARVTVTVPATATVTAPGLGGVRAGMTVSVVGSKQSSTAVTATAVTARRTS